MCSCEREGGICYQKKKEEFVGSYWTEKFKTSNEGNNNQLDRSHENYKNKVFFFFMFLEINDVCFISLIAGFPIRNNIEID